MEIICIFIGGAFGALLRYFVYSQFNSAEMAYLPTFIVNMIGCFVIGFCAYLFGRGDTSFNKYMKSMTTIGLAGGLTTFSTFALDMYRFAIMGNLLGLTIYLLVSVFLGVCLVSVGINCAYSCMVALIRSRKGYRR